MAENITPQLINKFNGVYLKHISSASLSLFEDSLRQADLCTSSIPNMVVKSLDRTIGVIKNEFERSPEELNNAVDSNKRSIIDGIARAADVTHNDSQRRAQINSMVEGLFGSYK